MLTVKHSNNGSEVVFEAKHVTFTSGGAYPFVVVFGLNCDYHAGPRFEGSNDMELQSGTVYVMNDTGKTIAVYRLPESSSMPAPVAPYPESPPMRTVSRLG